MTFNDTIRLEDARSRYKAQVAKYMRRDVYGLQNKICMCSLLNTKMIIRALDVDDNSDNTFLTTDERNTLLSNISIPVGCNDC